MSDSKIISLIKQMVNSDKSTRHVAVSELGSFLKAIGEFSDKEYVDIWKGLYECYWMCDKMVSQEDLSGRIADLTFILASFEQRARFLEFGLKKVVASWSRIDRWRNSKFLMLIRSLIGRYFMVLQNEHWSKDSVRRFASFLAKEIIVDDIDVCPIDIVFYVSSMYVDELSRDYRVVSEGNEIVKVGPRLLRPFSKLLATSSNKKLVNECRDDVFFVILENVGDLDEPAGDEDMRRIARTGGFRLSRKERELCEKKEENVENGGALKIRFRVIGENLIKLGSDRKCGQMNRNVLYDIGRRYIRFSETGQYQFKDEIARMQSLSETRLPKKLKLKSQLQSLNALKRKFKRLL